MYFGGSVVGKASTIGIEISPTSPLRSIAFKFGTEFRHVTDDTLQMFKVKSRGHMVKGQGYRVK